jgi:glycosyltransferase involved in cell wall biosynthesis
LKIVIAIPCLLQGGTEMQTLNLCRALRSFGREVSLLCYYEYDEAMVREITATGSVVNLLKMNRKQGPAGFISRLRKEYISQKPDIVHVQYMAPGALPLIAARLAGVRTVFATVHQPYTGEHGKMAKLILRIASLLTTRFMAVSQNAEKSWFGSASLFDETKPVSSHPRHFTIYNAVDSGRIADITVKTDRKAVLSKFNIPDNTTIIGTVSRLRHEKGTDILIDAFSLLAGERTGIYLLIAGSGPDSEKLKEQVNKKGISAITIFYGAAEWEEVISLISVMDIFVVPSRFEGFGLTAAEAMAAGKPVVASDIFGLKEVVRDNETGILFPVNDIVALMSALRRFLDDPDLREKYGKAGRERAAAIFSTELYTLKIKALYNI